MSKQIKNQLQYQLLDHLNKQTEQSFQRLESGLCFQIGNPKWGKIQSQIEGQLVYPVRLKLVCQLQLCLDSQVKEQAKFGVEHE